MSWGELCQQSPLQRYSLILTMDYSNSVWRTGRSPSANPQTNRRQVCCTKGATKKKALSTDLLDLGVPCAPLAALSSTCRTHHLCSASTTLPEPPSFCPSPSCPPSALAGPPLELQLYAGCWSLCPSPPAPCSTDLALLAAPLCQTPPSSLPGSEVKG